MATTKQELTERIRLIVQEMQADNARAGYSCRWWIGGKNDE